MNSFFFYSKVIGKTSPVCKSNLYSVVNQTRLTQWWEKVNNKTIFATYSPYRGYPPPPDEIFSTLTFVFIIPIVVLIFIISKWNTPRTTNSIARTGVTVTKQKAPFL